jgi:glucans biosynthesis protein
MLRGNGEWIWRPLTNPAQLRFNSYPDAQPHGFGLLQRDRNFDHYQDDGVFYERRPSVWVEPKSDWGKGAVQLVEIPSADESFDNIVCFWNPEQKPQAGQEHLFTYRWHWGSKMPVQPVPLAAIDGYRIMFDLKPSDDSVAPIDVRVYLAVDGQPLTETWLYQWTPPPVNQRHV